MGLLYVQTLLDYKHLEPSGQKETARRHVFKTNTSTNFSAKCGDESLICFWNQVGHCIFRKIRVRFRNQDAALNLTKNPVSNRNGARSQTN